MMRLPRGGLGDVVLILGASVSVVVLFAVLGSVGLPFGLRVVPLGEDYNWLLILRAPDAISQAQAFWAFDGRNPLSPWWYIATRWLYAGFPDGPFLTRLAVNPLVAISTYAAIRATRSANDRTIALACGLIVAFWTFADTLSQIHWNFLGALSLSLLSVAFFGAWLQSGRRSGGLYGLSMCLWFAAFATYAFQVGTILAVGLLSLRAAVQSGVGIRRVISRVTAEILPFALLLILFLLIWATTQNPGARSTFVLRPDLLLANLPKSIFRGLWPVSYWPFIYPAISGLGFWLWPIVAASGIGVGLIVRSSLPQVLARSVQPLWVIALGGCIVLPTALIESMSTVWTVGTRWGMVDQVWQPMLWLGVPWLAIGFMPRLRAALPMVAGFMAAFVLALSLGHNSAATNAATTESALRQGVTSLVLSKPSEKQQHFIVLVANNVGVYFPDVMSQRVVSAWLPNKQVTLRVVRHDARPIEPSDWSWWNIVLDDNRARNVADGGGNSPYEDVVFARFDGRNLTVINRLTKADVEGYPVEWQRSQPLVMSAVATEGGCRREWLADDASPVDGFRTAEQGPDGPFRWMVANPARLTLRPVCAGPALLKITVAMALAAEQWQTLSLRVGGVAIPLQVSPQGVGAVVRGEIPANAISPGQPLSLEFHVDALRTVPQTSVRLGVALRDVTLTPIEIRH